MERRELINKIIITRVVRTNLYGENVGERTKITIP